MLEDEPFLRTILAEPNDLTARLVYADWLDDRADPRAEYVRLSARVAELPFGHPERPALRERMLALQARLPSWWLAIIGYHATRSDPDPARIEEAARLLGRPVQHTDTEGYEITICAAAVSGLSGAIAYLESRSKWLDRVHDIHYFLRLRDSTGREVSCEPYTYNPFFGCTVSFMEWYGDLVLMLYQEKHDHYACLLGFDGTPVQHKIAFRWILDGRELAFRSSSERNIQRVSVPLLIDLAPLLKTQALKRGLRFG